MSFSYHVRDSAEIGARTSSPLPREGIRARLACVRGRSRREADVLGRNLPVRVSFRCHFCCRLLPRSGHGAPDNPARDNPHQTREKTRHDLQSSRPDVCVGPRRARRPARPCPPAASNRLGRRGRRRRPSASTPTANEGPRLPSDRYRLSAAVSPVTRPPCSQSRNRPSFLFGIRTVFPPELLPSF